MTNGEKLKEVFPSIELYEKSHDGIQIDFNSVWWNAEYKEPSSSEKPNKSEILTGSTTKRYAKQMGFKIETQPIPYLMHKEMDIPLLECQKAYDVAIDYLRSQGKLKG